MKNLSDSKQNNLSEEELLELSKISEEIFEFNTIKSVLMRRFVEQNLAFRCAGIFVGLLAVGYFVFFPFLYDTEIDPADIIAQSYRGILRIRLFIAILLGAGLVISFYDGRIFRGVLLAILIVSVNYSIDMYYFYNEYLTESDGAYQVFYYTRPALFVGLILMYINYNKS